MITELRLLVEETGATVRMDPRMMHAAPPSTGLLGALRRSPPETVAFELDGVRLRVSLHGEPFADRLEMGRYVNPVMWERGLGEFTDHRAYYKVHEAGIEGEEGPDAIFDRAAAVTATASVVARLSEPVGAIWLAARNSVPMRTFGAAMEQLKEGTAPLSFWLRWHVIPPGEMEDYNSGIVTGGLAAFTGREIMARPSVTETRVMIDHAFELARRMIDEKMAISDNQAVDGDGGARLRLRLGGRHRRGDSPVVEMSLLKGAAPRARPAEPGAEAAARPEPARHVAEPGRIEAVQIAAAAPIQAGPVQAGAVQAGAVQAGQAGALQANPAQSAPLPPEQAADLGGGQVPHAAPAPGRQPPRPDPAADPAADPDAGAPAEPRGRVVRLVPGGRRKG
ncbi:hypothetical protein [Paralimibaculum aggregatum]|nr:hypothetical protein [Limibaculum sp. NKW23]